MIQKIYYANFHQKQGEKVMIGLTELIFAFLPMLIALALAIFIITLFARLVRAVEKIADKFESSSKN